jgi:thiol-disulfide isomerase/thioredoxin
MVERALAAVILIAVAVAAWIIINRRALRRAAQNIPVDPLLTTVAPGQPVIVYFTTPFCVPCKTQQRPALMQLQQDTHVQVIEVDATQDTAAADRWGVFSAPTTFVLNHQLQPRHVNRGVAGVDVLRRQIETV